MEQAQGNLINVHLYRGALTERKRKDYHLYHDGGMSPRVNSCTSSDI